MARRLNEIPDPWLLCFTRPHAMEEYTPAPGEYEGPGWGSTYHLHCIHCPTIDHITLDLVGNTTHYYEPTKDRQEYLAARREAVTNGRGDVRLEHLRREQIRLRAARKARRRT